MILARYEAEAPNTWICFNGNSVIGEFCSSQNSLLAWGRCIIFLLWDLGIPSLGPGRGRGSFARWVLRNKRLFSHTNIDFLARHILNAGWGSYKSAAYWIDKISRDTHLPILHVRYMSVHWLRVPDSRRMTDYRELLIKRLLECPGGL